MKFKVIAEMRATFEVGVFEAPTAEIAMELAQYSSRYSHLNRMDGMGGVYDLRAKQEIES
jgi:hypothetical protein